MESGRTFSSKAGIQLPAGRWLLVVWIALLGACAVPVAYHDATTYRNLTEHKAEMMTLVEGFDALAYSRNEARIDQMRLAFRKAYEYELGKGKPNSDTARTAGSGSSRSASRSQTGMQVSPCRGGLHCA